MPIDWNSKESYQRLLAAVYAASPQNHNYRQIAYMFGQGATYDAIEGRFRKIKAEAQTLKQEVENGERPEPPPKATGSVQSTPKKKRATNAGAAADQGVRAGRVTKSKGGAGGGRGKKKAAAVQDVETSEESLGHEGWEVTGANASDEYLEED